MQTMIHPAHSAHLAAHLAFPGRRVRVSALAAAIAIALGALCCAGADAAALTERSKQKTAAEAERAQLQQKINLLKRDIGRTEEAKDDAADTLAQAEDAVSSASRSVRELEAEQRDTEARLKQFAQTREGLVKTVGTQQKRLATLLRGQYVSGAEDRIKLLLSGDNPNRINRELQYLAYVSLAQGRLITSLRGNLQAVEDNHSDMQNAKEEMQEILQEQQQQKSALNKDKGRRALLLSQLSSQLAAQRKEAGSLERDEQHLSGLVDQLAKLIKEQEKTVAQETRRQEQLADAKRKAEALAQAERDKQAKANLEKSRAMHAKAGAKTGAAKEKQNFPDSVDTDVAPPKSLAQNDATGAPPSQTVAQNGSFAAQRGKLRLPVRGSLTTKYGAQRGDGPNSKGLFIRAPSGADVRVVANGKVVFAEWLRGFGNLIIIDHGNQYMTIYGNNQTLFKRPGDLVKSGDSIASAGNSGGNDESGLYFEMRHQGRAFDPQSWVTIR